ncbi:response regulator transcription factor [Chungangia koreensis]|uniref:Response regulator transcription factor n=1 Tax=Chungangia koreensis TaxID=752657 RepID=A0ABV8X9T1_9LACT
MIRIVMAEDQKILRGALGALLNFEEDMEVIGEAGDGEEAVHLISQLQPDICLLDVEMPLKNGLEVAEEVKTVSPNSKIIVLTTFARPGYFERAMKAGVHGYLLKDGSIEDLTGSIRRVMAGKRDFAAELVMNSYREDNPLTEREQEVLSLAAEGNTYKEISRALYLSSGTVRNYMSEILQKMNAKNKVEAISMAKDKGWI